ncbi:F-box/LRR-repeat protein 4-like isoform X1 [Argiope bruennichi]|uniref:F-box/LRR-repeat protein 4-like isoform X1 n=1 Tax=Argiope bruennichi TaxID=94029 RepID=UPI002494D414|nr:F-box/LRR-repeat protein 4-like isoform X1 [Argiope bruennichi]
MMQRRNVRDLTPIETEEDVILFEMHKLAVTKGRNAVSSRAAKIVDFSSQYGNNNALSYTAQNLVGPPTVYPLSGDNAYSFHPRTYGKWWEISPSHLKSEVILPSTIIAESQDFIEFNVVKRVAPQLLRVYEVYNPGAIVKVLCYCYETEKWVIIWQGAPQVLPPEESRCFTVAFEGIEFMTDLYRLEFHHRHLDYFCEIDGLILYGENRRCSKFFTSENMSTKKYASNNEMEIDEKSEKNGLSMLPSEVTSFIFSFLDFRSLCSASRTSRLFKKICYDPALYRDLNLQPYWHLVDEDFLMSLGSRLSLLKKLNLSWCGGQKRITPSFFALFLKYNCQNLTSLRLANCSFVDNDCLCAVANLCPNLKELDIRCCRSEDLQMLGFKRISKMSNLVYLNLYRTLIDDIPLKEIIKSLKLKHLSIAACSNIQNINDIVNSIGIHLRSSLITLDIWRSVDLKCPAVREISECSNLLELDMSWCPKIDAGCGCLKSIIEGCPKLRKLFLSAIRTLSNSELYSIAMHCPDIEQLDILGSREYTLHGVKSLLQTCKKMKLLDVSYSSIEIRQNVAYLQTLFPAVSIKCSFPRTANAAH